MGQVVETAPVTRSETVVQGGGAMTTVAVAAITTTTTANVASMTRTVTRIVPGGV